MFARFRTCYHDVHAAVRFLNLSFIGWAYLCIFTLGLGFFWLDTYVKAAEANFYNDLIGGTEADTETEEPVHDTDAVYETDGDAADTNAN